MEQGITATGTASTPAAAYLAGLRAASRRTVGAALTRAATLAAGHRTDGAAYPFHRRPPASLLALRTALGDAYRPATANAAIAAVRGVLRAAWIGGALTREQYERRVAALKSVRGESAPGRALSGAEIARLFRTAAGDRNRNAGARDAALLAVLYGLGLCRAEAAAVRMEDLNPGAGTLLVRGKGRRERWAYFGMNGARAALDAWLRVRGTEPGPVFCPVSKGGKVGAGRGMTPTAVAYRVRTLGERAGLGKISPHVLRRSFATSLLQAGNDLAVTADLMGHARTDTTRIYDRRGEDAKRAASATLAVPYVAPKM